MSFSPNMNFSRITDSLDVPRMQGSRVAVIGAGGSHGLACNLVRSGLGAIDLYDFDVVSAAGDYIGGVLAPGIEISMDALFARAARLFKVDFVAPPTVIGKTTATGLQSGFVYGFAGQVDGIVARIREELGVAARVIATGGLAGLVAPHSTTIDEVDPFLTLDGLRLVWELRD